MKIIAFVFFGCFFAVVKSTCATENQTSETVKNRIISKADAILASANVLDNEIQRYGQKSKATDQARLIISNMYKSVTWLGLRLVSRDQLKNKEKEEVLTRKYLDDATAQITQGKNDLEAAKLVAYQTLAKTNPKAAAQLLLLEKRKQAAEAETAAVLMRQAQIAVQNDAALADSEQAAEDARWAAQSRANRQRQSLQRELDDSRRQAEYHRMYDDSY